MYWANGGEDPKIERADLDGSNRHTVVSNVTRPTGLTIDFTLGVIFWVDAEKKVIECADLNGTNRRTVATELPMKAFCPNPVQGFHILGRLEVELNLPCKQIQWNGQDTN